MMLDRRKFLRTAGAAGGVVLLGGALVGTRVLGRISRRKEIERELLQNFVPMLAKKAPHELTTLPSRAQEDMRRYFHGRCLNVHGFLGEICSVTFGEKLAVCGSEKAKHQLLTLAFENKVVAESVVLARVDTVAQEIGQELDQGWYSCCRHVAKNWQVSLDTGAGEMTGSRLSASVEPLILRELSAVRQSTYPIGRRPALSQTVKSIGKSAIGLLPVAVVSPGLALPLFLLAALKPIWQYVTGQLRHRPAAYQRAITSRLSLLGNRVGMEFLREVKQRVTDLHAWQEQALRQTATRYAEQAVPLFV